MMSRYEFESNVPLQSLVETLKPVLFTSYIPIVYDSFCCDSAITQHCAASLKITSYTHLIAEVTA
ncbi:hypothetical protein SHVI106290_00625 [Shewanella violacea]